MTAEELKVTEWEENEHGWSLKHQSDTHTLGYMVKGIEPSPADVDVLIEKRPVYCDRGHWMAKVFGVPNIDDGDMFPRYFMSLEAAKQEMKAWLVWRIYKETDRI